VCVPDEPKIEVLTYLLKNGKHVLVEKPLWAADDRQINTLEQLARVKGVVCYTAYNHRFEPHYVRMRNLVASGTLGTIYRCRMFYGNGTARLVRDSAWRDQGAGVLPDLGSHLLDTAKFWFGEIDGNFEIVSANCFENRAPDHVVMISKATRPRLECKWGPTTFTHRTRILPSGRPSEESVTLVEEDPTWVLEYAHFKSLCERGTMTDLSSDLWLNRLLRRLGQDARKEASS
jgi:predicted dehydrogenase